MAWVGTIVAYALYAILLQRHLVQSLHSLTVDRYIVAVCFAVNIVSFRLMSPLVAGWLRAAAGPIRWAAGATFTLYLLHLPVAQFLSVLAPWRPASALRQLFVVGGTLIVVFVVAQHTERRKEQCRRWIATGFRLIAGTVHIKGTDQPETACPEAAENVAQSAMEAIEIANKRGATLAG